MELRLRQKGDLFCLGDSSAPIGDWDFALLCASKMAPRRNDRVCLWSLCDCSMYLGFLQ